MFIRALQSQIQNAFRPAVIRTGGSRHCDFAVHGDRFYSQSLLKALSVSVKVSIRR